MKSPTTQTLTANGSTAWHVAEGTIVQMRVSKTFGGGSVAIEIKDTEGAAIPLTDGAGSVIAITAAQAQNIELPAGTSVRGTLSGATSPELLVSIHELSDMRAP